MGRNKVKPLNQECPICYEDTSNNFILPCGHQFDYYCLQKTFFDYFINNKKSFCPLCRADVNKKTMKLIFKNIYIPYIHPTDFVTKNTLNLNKKIKIKKFEKIDITTYLTYLIPCYTIENINVPHFFHLDNIEFVYESFINDIEKIYEIKLNCLLNRTNNDWYKFIKNNNLQKKLNNSTNKNDDPNNSISVYIRNRKNLVTYNERYGTVSKSFIFYDQKSTLLFRTYLVNWYDNNFFINELYGICYKN
jgi:hypothetical protein